ncbi:DDE-type integrase/transposase/recombinase [Saccharomonospora halophila]|uniref:DDE-type integrase/transposase/recombinase n=1 Tax=Saccharomonospora halophila TaxID=129922 RepID=UPI00048CAC7E
MVGDITYIPTGEGWVYLATVIDCYSKAVVGWAIDDHYRTPLIEEAIRMAARNHTLPARAIFHSDRSVEVLTRQLCREAQAVACSWWSATGSRFTQ